MEEAAMTEKSKKSGAGTKAAPEAPSKGTQLGVVDSDARAKTRRVVVSYLTKHPKYGKYVRQRTVLHVHDEQSESKSGDVVEVAPCKPISATKAWRLVRVVERRADRAAAIRSVKEVK
jgi:small subunit ribosomal protein S17